MPSTYSPNLRIELIASGEQANTWGNTTNTNLGILIEQAIAGLSSIDVTAGNVTLTAYNGASDQSRQMILNVTGTPGVARTLTAPSVSKVYVIANNSNADVTIETATGTGVTVSSGYSKFVFCDGTDFSDVTTETTVLAVEDLIVNGDATLGDALTDVITINGTVQPGVVISGSSSSAALRITQTGAGNALVVEDSANPDATPFVVDASGNVSVGGNLNVPGLTASRALATDASKNLVSSTATSTELGYLSGVTSAIQTQLNGKAGTADANTFTNNQIISVNSASDALRITQTGAGNALVVEDSANPDSTPFVITTDGRQLLGYTTSLTAQGITAQIQNNGTSAGQGGGTISNTYWQANTTASAFLLNKSRSATPGSYSILSNGDGLGIIAFGGDDGTAIIRAAAIDAAVDGTPGTNDMPGRLVFSTTADGASSPTERMRIDSAGRVSVGNAAYAGINFTVSKNITGATTATSAIIEGITQSDVTSFSRGVEVQNKTAATSFTLANYYSFSARQGTFGAGSTVTNQIGFAAESTLTGATNNYGFYSSIASGSGRYNFYAAGTADNYFAGNTYTASGTTSMTSGFFYIPSAAGAPTGAPTAVSGRVPMYYDTTNNNFYVYNGAWKKVLLA